jgi:hypothetical protein
MLPKTPAVTAGATSNRKECACQPSCPVCSGPLVPLRGAFRCVRCSFTICEGCEGGEGEPTYGAGD